MIRQWLAAGVAMALLASGCTAAVPRDGERSAASSSESASSQERVDAAPSRAATTTTDAGSPSPSGSASAPAKAVLRPSVATLDKRTGAQRNLPFTVNGIVVVSAKHRVNGSFRPKVTSGRLMAPAARAFARLRKAIEKAGLRLYLVSGYRSHASQSALYRRTMASMGRAYTTSYVAQPGTSEHQTGLAIDVRSPSGRGTGFDDTREWRWLRAHAQDYGFVLRYPRGATTVTGIGFEPWHWRYVGVRHARAIRALGANMTIEQYLRLA